MPNPIFISLNGDLYADKSKELVGTINGDHRLTTLDAFLDALNSSSECAKIRGDYTLGTALRNMVEKCPANILQSHDVVVEVTATIDQKSNAITHKFRVCSQERK